MLDTGASTTCISPDVVNRLQLQAHSKTKMGGPTGVKAYDVYDIRFAIQMDQKMAGSQYRVIPAIGVGMLASEFDVLIGRDILCFGYMAASFDGTGIFCW